MKRYLASTFVAAGMISSSLAQTGTNATIGLLGYSVGTILTVEGTAIREGAGGWKGFGLQIRKVNGVAIAKSISMSVGNIDKYQAIATNTTCCFRGIEKTYVFGEDPLHREQYPTPGRTYHTFWVIEVVAPKDIGLWSEKEIRSSEPAGSRDGVPAVHDP